MNTSENLPIAAREVIVIDAGVTDWKTLIAGLSPDIPVILLPAGGNGLEALAAALAGYGGLDALHLVSHGGTGFLNLGNLRLSSANLGEQGEALMAIASHLSTDSDLLVYGCSVAAGEVGQAFVQELSSALNGVDIAASTDRTGPLVLGGDWDLEYAVGEIETVLPFTVQGMEGIDECLGCVLGGNEFSTTNRCPVGSSWEEDPIITPPADSSPPAFSSATVNASTLVMTYGEALSSTAPFASAFTVKVGGLAQATPTNVAVNSANKTVTLTLAAAVTNGQTVTVTYTDPTVDNDTNAIQDSTGNDAAPLLDQAVTNNTPDFSPSVTSINRVTTATTNATSVEYTVTFSQAVTGVDISDFLLSATGTANGTISGISGGLTSYTVTVNSVTGDGTLRLDLKSSGTGIQNATSVAIATGGYTSGQTYTLDHTAPNVSSVTVPANATYIAGQNLDFTVNFSEAVTVDTTGGTPRVALTLDTGGTVYASYLSGSGTTAVVFRYTVQSGNLDSNGITFGGVMDASGGTLKDAAGNNATLTLNSVGSTTLVLVDAVLPTLDGANSTPADDATNVALGSDIVIDFSENIAFGSSGSIITVRNVTDNVTVGTFTVPTAGAAAAGVFGTTSISGDKLTINPAGDLIAGKSYAVQFGTGVVVDAAGNALAAIANDTAYNFSTIPADAAPSITNLNADSVAWAGVGNWVNLDSGTLASASDAEFGVGNGEWNGATLTINRVTGGTVDGTNKDLFKFVDNASFTLQDGNAYTSYPTQSIETAYALGLNATGALNDTANTGWFARWSYTYLTGTLVIQFGATASGDGDINRTATTALVQSVLQSIAYRNDVPNGDATIRFSLSDGTTATAADVAVTSSTITVNKSDDDADSDAADGFSLREGLARGVAQAGADTIKVVLAGSPTVTLGSGVTTGAGDTLDFDNASGVIVTGSTISLGGGLTVTNGSSDTVEVASALAGAGALVKTGAGKLTLSNTGNSTNFSGTTTVTAGSLEIASDSRLGSGAVTLNGGTLALANINGTVDNAITLGSNGGTVSVLNSAATLSGVISGTGALAKTGGQALTLSGANTYSGGTSISGGTLSVGNHVNLGSGAVSLSGGATLKFTGPATSYLTLSGGGTLQSGTSGASVTSNTFDDFQNALDIGAGGGIIEPIPGSSQLALRGALTGSGALTISNAPSTSYLNFWNANSFTGNIIVGSNVYIEAYGTSGFGSGQITFNSGFLGLYVSGSTRSITNNMVLAGDTTLSTDSAAYLMGTGAIITFSGNISESAGPRNLTLGNDEPALGNAIVLSGTNTYTGTTTIKANSKVSVASDSNLGAGALSLGGGSTLVITGSNTIDNSVTLAGNATVEVAGAAVSAGLSGVISGISKSLTKTGAGTLTLSGVNTYTGATAVTAGTLDVTGTVAGATSVSSGASLAGTGTLSGAVSVASGGTLTPGGDNASALAFGAGLTLSPGATLTAQANGTTAGSGYDQLAVTGTVNVTGSTLSFALGYTPAAGDVFVLINNDGVDAITGTVKVGGTTLVEGATFLQDGLVFAISYVGGSNNDLVLSALGPRSLAYSATTFSEAAANNGSVITTSTITLSNDTFSGAVGAALGTVTQVPAGLTAVLVKASATTATLSFTGTATAHANAQDIANLTVTFADADFVAGSAATVTGATRANLVIDFSDPAPVDDGGGVVIPVTDTDGVSDATENAGPGLTPTGGGTAVAGDGNGDGVADSQQSGVTSTPFRNTDTAVSNPGTAAPVYLTLVADARDGKIDSTDANTATLTNVRQLDAPTNLPATVKLPLGLISFNSTVGLSGVAGVGVTETFSLYVDPSLGATAYWKQNAAGTWVNLASATYGGKVVTEAGKTRLDFAITDGGEFDSDRTVNGVIADPGGVGFSVNTAPTITGVPTIVQQVTAGTPAALPDFTVADAEQGTTNLGVSLIAINGTISGLTDTNPNATGIQLSGTAASLNAALAGALFTATSPGAANITLGVSDGIASATVSTYNLQATDTDGIPDTAENAVTPLSPGVGGMAVAGDGNGDGVADSQQSNVTSAPFLKTSTAISNPGTAAQVYITLVADAKDGKTDTSDANTATLSNVRQLDAPTSVPATLKMPLGLLAFNTNVGLSATAGVGVTETFSLYTDTSLGINGYFKQNTAGAWVNLANSVTQEGGKTRVDFSLTDGSEFDADHLVNGTIVDPGALGAAARPVFGLRDKVLALYIAYYDRAPDVQGLQYWVNQAQAGQSLNSISAGFAAHPRFAQEYGGLSNTQIAAKLYLNFLHRPGDTAGLAYWAGELQSKSISEVVVSFTGSVLDADLSAALSQGALMVADYSTAYQRQKVLENLMQASEHFMSTFGAATTPTLAADALAQDPAYLAAQRVLNHIDSDMNAVYNQRDQLVKLVGQVDAMQQVVGLLG